MRRLALRRPFRSRPSRGSYFESPGWSLEARKYIVVPERPTRRAGGGPTALWGTPDRCLRSLLEKETGRREPDNLPSLSRGKKQKLRFHGREPLRFAPWFSPPNLWKNRSIHSRRGALPILWRLRSEAPSHWHTSQSRSERRTGWTFPMRARRISYGMSLACSTPGAHAFALWLSVMRVCLTRCLIPC
jgi:hypothetical protein